MEEPLGGDAQFPLQPRDQCAREVDVAPVLVVPRSIDPFESDGDRGAVREGG